MKELKIRNNSYNLPFVFTFTAQKMKFSIKDFFGKCDQIRKFPWIWSHLLKKSLMENLILVQCCVLAEIIVFEGAYLSLFWTNLGFFVKSIVNFQK